ncbi:MAG: DsbA family oxidoreductase [Intrasporangium sp.]|uniref:DsbA family oxidoreductase n=1 Tax=Intrasporangium sp. TaxID=1925024 RepID=UPI002648806C|nr:DsbA family oxidoreductase [Intrasporangium sp.]MDN5794355.1 DsbA family oxidoreductase [Intrasporangium sp.]
MTDQLAADSTTPVTFDLWVDLVSAWCYIAKRRIEAAIGLFERPHDVTLVCRSWQLHPDLEPGRDGPVEPDVHLPGEHLAPGEQRVLIEQAAVDHEIRLEWDRAVRANTLDAHRLCALALDVGGTALESAMVERCFAAHFTEGLALDDLDVLQRISAEAGLDEGRVAAVLSSDDFADRVRADEHAGRRAGATTVPYLVANGTAGLAGLHSVEAYLTLLRDVATGSP